MFTFWRQIENDFLKLKDMKKKIIFYLGILCFFLTIQHIGFSIYHIRTNNVNKKLEQEIAKNKDIVIRGIIGNKGSLYRALRSKGLSYEEILKIEKAMKKIFNPRKCRDNHNYELIKFSNGNFKALKYYYSSLEFCLVVKYLKSSKLKAYKVTIPLDKVIKKIGGKITYSLYESMEKNGLSLDLILSFTQIFAWQVDFLTQVRQGDVYKLIWESYEKDGKTVLNGKILAAEYTGRRIEKHTAIFFTLPNDRADYFSPDGRSLRKEYLIAPLNYRRINSYFSYRRFHPILRIYRPHLGIDFAAPKGTPIVSVSDGIIEYTGWKGGFGKYIKIRHKHGISTTYGHLLRYAKNIRSGMKVVQGQIIGYVGSSGLATGPHLDFRMIIKARYVNPLKVISPPAKSVPAKYRCLFNQTKDKMINQLNLIKI